METMRRFGLFVLTLCVAMFATAGLVSAGDSTPLLLADSDAATAVATAASWIAVGTFWFWVLVALEVVLLFSFVENDQGILATISILVFGAILQWASGVDIIGFVISNPVKAIGIAVSYVLIGVFWSGFRFHWYYSGEVQRLVDNKGEWLRNKLNLPYGQQPKSLDIPEELKEAWNEHIDEDSPQMMRCKNKILRWMGYWPISVIWFLVSDFVVEIFTKIYNRLAAVYESIARSIRNRAKV